MSLPRPPASAMSNTTSTTAAPPTQQPAMQDNRRFYIPTTSTYVSPTLPASGYVGRSRSSLTIEDSLYRFQSAGSGGSSIPPGSQASPRFRRGRGRGQSLVALTTALQSYRVPPEPSVDTHPLVLEGGYQATGVDDGGPRTPPTRSRVDQATNLEPAYSTPPAESQESSGWAMAHHGHGVEMEIMDALVEIHRVMYRGREDQVDSERGERGWEGEVRELERVVGRWFEGDAIYDHPFLRLPSRHSVLNHFVLLHLLGSASVPALTPGNALVAARGLVHRLAERVCQAVSLRAGAPRNRFGKDEEAGQAERWSRREEKGKGRAETRADRFMEQQPLAQGMERWKLWQVGAECTEIGGMECYEGYHLGLIEHVITLNLLPSLSSPHPKSSDPLSTRTSSSSLSLLDNKPNALVLASNSALAPRSFGARLAGALGREFGGLLTWELPISTVVQFNEVGKVTHIRDTIDIQDLIETFVPFAKRLNWLTRRVAGLVSSSVGSVVLGLVVPRAVKERMVREGMIPVLSSVGNDKLREAFGSEIPSTAISRDEMSTASDPGSDAEPFPAAGVRGLGLGRVNTNLLGLEGMAAQRVLSGGAGMAPDRDEEGY